MTWIPDFTCAIVWLEFAVHESAGKQQQNVQVTHRALQASDGTHRELHRPVCAVSCQNFWLMALVHCSLFPAHFWHLMEDCIIFVLLISTSQCTSGDNSGRIQTQITGRTEGNLQSLSNNICSIVSFWSGDVTYRGYLGWLVNNLIRFLIVCVV